MNFKKHKGFSMVELMIVIAVVTILAAIAIPAYSNYIIKTRLTEKLTLIDNYKKDVSNFLIDQGVKTESDLDNFDNGGEKSVYYGDGSAEVMSGVKNNNGRIVASEEIQGTNYQIALTPEIRDNSIVWDCTISVVDSNETPNQTAMPNNCLAISGNQHDDQVNYNENFTNYDNEKISAYNDARNDWEDRTNAAAAADDDYQTALDNVSTAHDAKDTSKTLLNDANTDLTNAQNAEASALVDKNNKATTLANAESAVTAAENTYGNGSDEYNDAVAARDTAQTKYDNSVQAHTDAQTDTSTAQTAKNTAQTNYNNDYAAYSTAVDTANSQYSDIQSASKDTDSGSYTNDYNTANATFTDNVSDLNGDDKQSNTTNFNDPNNYITDPDDSWESNYYSGSNNGGQNFSNTYKDLS